MSVIEKPFAYFDTGSLSAIRELHIDEFPFRIVYSDAHLADLGNSRTPELELQFLRDQEAHFVCTNSANVEASYRDPFEAFNNRKDMSERYLAPMISLFSGGGPTQTDQEAAVSFVQMLANEEEPLLKEYLVSKIEKMEFSSLTNRRISQGLDSSIETVDVSEGLRSLFAKIPDPAKKKLDKVFPKQNPSFHEIVNCALMLGMMGVAPSKNIRKEAKGKSQEAARHDWLDCHHIAFGLHCSIFSSNDKAALKRARLLKDYWNCGTEIVYIGRK